MLVNGDIRTFPISICCTQFSGGCRKWQMGGHTLFVELQRVIVLIHSLGASGGMPP